MPREQSTNGDLTNNFYTDIGTYIEQHGITGVNKFAHDQLDSWKKISLNIGVTGRSDTGKSTFINTIRMLEPEDEGAAIVSVVECKNVLTPYVHPDHNNLIFWDLPGKESQVFCNEHIIFL
jgi:predicted GTPase